MGTEVNAWAGTIRWLEGETESEWFPILDATLISFFFPATNAPGVPIAFEAAIDRDGTFAGPINDETPAAITMSPAVDTWLSLDDSLAEVVAHSWIRLVADAPLAADYEARYHAKRV